MSEGGVHSAVALWVSGRGVGEEFSPLFLFCEFPNGHKDRRDPPTSFFFFVVAILSFEIDLTMQSKLF